VFMIRAAEPSDWEAVRDIRLRSLREEPDAYASDYQTEARFEPTVWKQRLATASSYLAFDDDHALVGIATGLDTGDGKRPGWVISAHKGHNGPSSCP
jgi:hypothetical protein